VEWTAGAIATSKPGKSIASLAVRRLARKRAIDRKERFAPVYRAMREALGKGDWDEFHRQGRLLHQMGGASRRMSLARREALFAKLASLCREYE
jgi:hypothetical protein